MNLSWSNSSRCSIFDILRVVRTAVTARHRLPDSAQFGVFIQCRRRGVQSRRAHGDQIWHLPTTPGCDGCPHNLSASARGCEPMTGLVGAGGEQEESRSSRARPRCKRRIDGVRRGAGTSGADVRRRFRGRSDDRPSPSCTSSWRRSTRPWAGGRMLRPRRTRLSTRASTCSPIREICSRRS